MNVRDIVFVGTDVKRINRLCRIIKTFPGRDQQHGVATVETMNGEILRPYQRLYPLEIDSERISNEK